MESHRAVFKRFGIDIRFHVNQLCQAFAMPVGSGDVQWSLAFLIGGIDVGRVDQLIQTFHRTFSGTNVQCGNNIRSLSYQNVAALVVLCHDSEVQGTIQVVRSGPDQAGEAVRLPPFSGFMEGVIKSRLAGLGTEQIIQEQRIALPDSGVQYVFDIRPGPGQHVEVFCALPPGGNVQGCLTIVSGGIDIGTVVNQNSGGISMAVFDGNS